MSIDWNLAHVDWAQVPNLGDILLKRTQYQRGLDQDQLSKLQIQGEQNQLQEHQNKMAALQKIKDQLMNPHAQQGQPMQPPAPGAAPMTPQAPQAPPGMGAALGQGAIAGAGMAGSPMIPPGMPLVKPPDDQVAPDVKMPSNMSPAASAAAKQKLTQHQNYMDEFQRRRESILGQQPDILAPLQSHPELIDALGVEHIAPIVQAGIALRAKQQHEADVTAARSLAQESKDALANASLDERTRKDTGTIEALQSRAKTYADLADLKESPEERNAREARNIQARYLGQADIADRNNTARGSRQQSSIEAKSAIQDKLLEYQRQKLALTQAGLDERQQQKLLAGQAAELGRLTAEYGSKMDPGVLAGLKSVIEGTGAPSVEPATGWFGKPKAKVSPTGAPAVVNPSSLRKKIGTYRFPSAPETPEGAGAQDSPTASPNAPPAGRPVPKVSGATGMRPAPDFQRAPSPATDDKGKSKPGLETPAKVQDADRDEENDPFAKLRKKKKVALNAQ